MWNKSSLWPQRCGVRRGSEAVITSRHSGDVIKECGHVGAQQSEAFLCVCVLCPVCERE